MKHYGDITALNGAELPVVEAALLAQSGST